ncbi:hypothetical protein FQN55_005991 [Onygenales sp. PD_40]|nr:hypothetical protein FQN55_005991 [Onygenales sp. PD_40]KAK2764854.1 hypothetical protein FQN53_006936 [Emmonsiellopsis sp. PD_33]
MEIERQTADLNSRTSYYNIDFSIREFSYIWSAGGFDLEPPSESQISSRPAESLDFEFDIPVRDAGLSVNTVLRESPQEGPAIKSSSLESVPEWDEDQARISPREITSNSAFHFRENFDEDEFVSLGNVVPASAVSLASPMVLDSGSANSSHAIIVDAGRIPSCKEQFSTSLLPMPTPVSENEGGPHFTSESNGQLNEKAIRPGYFAQKGSHVFDSAREGSNSPPSLASTKNSVSSRFLSRVKSWRSSRVDDTNSSLRSVSKPTHAKEKSLSTPARVWSFKAKKVLRALTPKRYRGLPPRSDSPVPPVPNISFSATTHGSSYNGTFSSEQVGSGTTSATSSVFTKRSAKFQCQSQFPSSITYGHPNKRLDVSIVPESGPAPFQCTFCSMQCENQREWVHHEQQIHMYRQDHSDQPQQALRDEDISWEWLEAKRNWFWNCGFCDFLLQSWDERQNHIAEHFKEGVTVASWKPLRTPYPLDQYTLTPVDGFPDWNPTSLLASQRPRIQDFVDKATGRRLPWCQDCKIPLTDGDAYELHIREWHDRPVVWQCPNIQMSTTKPDYFFDTLDETSMDNISIQDHLINEGLGDTKTYDDFCLCCGDIFPANPPNPEERRKHLEETHHFDETERGPKFFREEQFRIHLANCHNVRLGYVDHLMKICSLKEAPPAMWEASDFV